MAVRVCGSGVRETRGHLMPGEDGRQEPVPPCKTLLGVVASFQKHSTAVNRPTAEARKAAWRRWARWWVHARGRAQWQARVAAQWRVPLTQGGRPQVQTGITDRMEGHNQRYYYAIHCAADKDCLCRALAGRDRLSACHWPQQMQGSGLRKSSRSR